MTKEKIHEIAEAVLESVEKGEQTVKTTISSGLHPKRIVDMTVDFFRLEAAGGIVLVLASALALIIANTPLFSYYNYFFHDIDFAIGFTDPGGWNFELHKPLLLWINDGLMAVFFFLVGLEIKREITEGELSSPRKALLPIVAAIGGMAAPALIYWFINRDNPAGLDGWAIPAATDIAFALGVLALVGSRAPVSLKILLTAIAIIDDIGAILIIAVFYTAQMHMDALLFALLPLAGLLALNRRGVASTAPYVLLGIILWIAVLKSGVHATIAGVVAALFIPMHTKQHKDYSPAKHLEHALHPWAAFLILPVFGFANAGVPFHGMGWDSLLEPVTLGIALGLFAGKQVGVFTVMGLCILLGLTAKPKGAGWLQLYAVSLLCGVGFTMSLFIGGLAFSSLDMQASVRLGVLVGSLLSAVLAFVLLRFAPAPRQQV
jgi:NhaA family Na+:H+ antiporter